MSKDTQVSQPNSIKKDSKKKPTPEKATYTGNRFSPLLLLLVTVLAGLFFYWWGGR
jgi:hypothetical protein